MSIIRTIDLVSPDYPFFQPPLAVGVAFNPQMNEDVLPLAGVFFNPQRRIIAVEGVRDETGFWQHCQNCPLYLKRECTGGHQVLSADMQSPRVMLVENGQGLETRYHYPKEFCRMGYTLQNTVARIPLDIPPVFVFVQSSYLNWFAYKEDPQNPGQLVFVPNRFFNTEASGTICTGDARFINRDSVSERYEKFLARRANSDLCPVNRPNFVNWIRAYTPENYVEQGHGRWQGGTNAFRHLDSYSGSRLELLPNTVSRVIFMRVNPNLLSDYTLPEYLRELTRITIPFVKLSGDTSIYPYFNLTQAVTNFSDLRFS